MWNLPGGPVIRILLSMQGNTGSFLIQEDSTCHRASLSLCSMTTDPLSRASSCNY